MPELTTSEMSASIKARNKALADKFYGSGFKKQDIAQYITTVFNQGGGDNAFSEVDATKWASIKTKLGL